MSDAITRFILDRIVNDYVRLRKAGIAPEPIAYVNLWPKYSDRLTQDILFTEYRLRAEWGQSVSVEAFLAQNPFLKTDGAFVLRLLEFELENADESPDTDSVCQRFPQINREQLSQAVELAQLRRSWKPKSQTVSSPTSTQLSPQTEGPGADSNQTAAFTPDATVQRQPDSNQTAAFAPDTTVQLSPQTGGSGIQETWSQEKSQTLQWSVHQTNDADQTIAPTGTPTAAVSSSPQPSPLTPTAKGAADVSQKAGTPEPRSRDHLTTTEFSVTDTLTVEKFLGSGRWKDVYKAKQESTRQFVALKHLREKNDAEREGLVREVRTQAKLTHQNIPPVFALETLPSGQAIVVEKLVDGDRWSDTIRTRTLEDNLRILLEIAYALSFAHRQHHIIHRDLKPDNVVINDKYDEVYLIDWGLAIDVGDAKSDSEDMVPHVSTVEGVAGTPLYWAPELAAGEPWKCSPATDVFLLGAMLYEVLTGHAPYEMFDPRKYSVGNVSVSTNPQSRMTEAQTVAEVGPMLRAVRAIIIPPLQWHSERYMPDELVAVAMKAMALEPSDRYADAGNFIDAIKQYQHFAIVTSRCDKNWKQLKALTRERCKTAGKPSSLLALTLRFLETADIFHGVIGELQGRDDAPKRRPDENATEIHPTLLAARKGEIEARKELVGLTLESGDLTLADAQIGLMERNPLHDPATTNLLRHQVRTLQQARKRARMMKWVAVGLLAVFLGSSILYGFLINEQYKQTAKEYRRAEENRARAEENFQKAQSAVNEFFTEFAKEDAVKSAGLMPLRRKLLDSARRYYDDFASQKHDNPDVIAGKVSSLFDMGGIEEGFGNGHDAIDYYLKAIQLGEALVSRHPDNEHYLEILSKCYKDLAVVYEAENFDAGRILDCNEKALTISRKLVADHPDVPEFHRNLARALHNFGVFEFRHGNDPKAIAFFDESLNVREGMLRFPDPPEYHFGKSQTQFLVGMVFAKEGRPDEADKKFDAALQTIEELKTTKPDKFRNEDINLQATFLMERAKLEKNEVAARQHFEKALEPLGVLVKKSPENIMYQDRLNEAKAHVFEFLVRENRFDDAMELFKEREEELLETGTVYPDVIKYLAEWYLTVAELHVKQNRKAEAIEALKNAVDPLEVLGDKRTVDEDELLQKIRDRLAELEKDNP